MEATVQSSGLGNVVKEERMESNARNENLGEAGKVGNGHEDNNTKPSSPNQKEKDISTSKQVPLVTAIERSPMDTVSRASSSMKKAQDQLESARAEMGKVREENKVLKTTLARIMKEYQYLQMHLTNSPQLEVAKKPTDIDSGHQEIEEPEFVSLTLGRDSSEPKKDEKNSNSGKGKENEQLKEGLALRLDCKFEGSNLGSPEPASNPSPENSFEEPKEEEAGETWPPSKILKTMRSGVDEASQQTNIKRARVSVRARCDTPTMNDGCQWRKYGQKIAKGNPCPRAYYRCTVAPACPVRKQVQRFAEDMTILITTYEGTHNHPLPMSATAMASTTSAAACMLMTGSSSSGSAAGASATNTTSANLHGLNFNLSDNTRSRQFYLPNTSISSSPSYPTITLDLTAPPSSSSASSSQINRLSSSFDPSSRYSSTSFNFSSSESNSLPTSWGNGYLTYGATHPYNKNQIGSLNLGRQPQEHFYQPYMQTSQPTPPQQSLTETIAAATKAITLDPSFRSVLEAAITSIVNKDSRENFGQNSKWNEPLAAISSYSSAPNGNGHASSYLN